MNKSIKSTPKAYLLALHELQAWENGIEPEEMVGKFNEPASRCKEQAKAYMLAHEQFLRGMNEILKDSENCGKSSLQDIYDNMLQFCAERAEVAMTWTLLKR